MSDKPVRLGFVGLGGRGSYHLDCALGMTGVEVPALCETVDSRLQQAAKWVTDSGRPAPRLYGRGPKDFERLCAEEQLDCVICVTPWEWHTPVCLAANRNGKNAVTELPCVLTVEQAWALVESFEKTGKWSTLALEQVLLEVSDGAYLTLFNMVHEGVLGDMVHGESGYLHDLREVKFPGGSEPWRLEHYIKRNGNLYPDHPMNRLMPMMDINHGDRFDFLVSSSSRSGTLNEYAIATLGKDHPLATTKYAQGDFNATLLHTEGGRMITLNHDTNTPHPRELYRLQGTKGVFLEALRDGKNTWIYLDGISPTAHEWEPAGPYLEEYKHPLIKSYNPPPRQAIRGHGSGSRTPLTWYLLVKNLREGKMPYFDVYDSVTSSVITALTEVSVGNRSRPVEFPDFTRGKWKTRGPMQFG